ncbi:MAG: bifunctional DNA-binding transcriptional regulator/O6-methylguanine-DNA methyltransferase Ada [Gammaproteobacteria bacterium]|nr:bifunctional DNA-binding transcriptional regulator/O6-methylguanine-DNA methyltransferase Ada [Gammaproteobacteria bacterium]MYH86557.1 bifunctional DNA-binding transcriptional regulator/O6-methylguanine-DNA methyltransferase Ada [Gammaproteobacteria bacterium]MYK04771.1 bifunctional DNA-binding transcriptional regulator/O6-methylguanine-DNA methyltransferase Ada [Gammaproteobacteria bacterium]
MMSDMQTSPIIENPPLPDEDDCWAAVVERDPGAAGQFFYAVLTTGVYCRPGCPARLPLRENVRFHATCADAEEAGFRPCRRCKPDEPPPAEKRSHLVEAACRLIETSENPPSLEELARNADMSPYHFHRVFKSVTGCTPKAYAAAHQTGRMRESLRDSGTITEAIYDAGFNSPSRFYAKAPETLGMSPANFQGGGKGEKIRFAVADCSLGAILIAATEKGVCAILLGDRPESLVDDLENRFPNAILVAGDPEFEALASRAIGQVETPANAVDLPLDIRGTAFQHKVWNAIRKIPSGETASYGQIANRIGAAGAARAVAGACAANPLAVAVPCHRVVRNDGSLSGYRWGIERKRTLLKREATSSNAAHSRN